MAEALPDAQRKSTVRSRHYTSDLLVEVLREMAKGSQVRLIRKPRRSQLLPEFTARTVSGRGMPIRT